MKNIMTDNEIIKAWELCFAEKGTKQTCGKCPYHKFGELCKVKRDRDTPDLINRQSKVQDEIDKFARDLCKERLLKGKAIADFDDLQEYIRKEKAEAIKEFITKHREMMLLFCDDDDQISLKVCEYDVNTKGILEEMVGEDE